MDTAQKESSSTITEFLQSEGSESMPQNVAEEPMKRLSHGSPPPRHLEHQQYFPLPPPGYYPFYPPPFPPTPTMNYIYMDLLRHLSLGSELCSYLPKFEEFCKDNNSKDCKSKKSNTRLQNAVQMNECGHSHCKDRAYREYSTLCLSCEQRLQCSCCTKPHITERPPSMVNKLSCNCCQCLQTPHSLMPVQHKPILSCNCACKKQKQKKPKQKSKQKCFKNKCNQTCLQSDGDNIPERDNPSPQITNKVKISKRTYRKYGTSESSSSDESSENQRVDSEIDYKSEDEQIYGFYAGKGDENKDNSSKKKSEGKKKEKKTRRSLAYFINV